MRLMNAILKVLGLILCLNAIQLQCAASEEQILRSYEIQKDFLMNKTPLTEAFPPTFLKIDSPDYQSFACMGAECCFLAFDLTQDCFEKGKSFRVTGSAWEKDGLVLYIPNQDETGLLRIKEIRKGTAEIYNEAQEKIGTVSRTIHTFKPDVWKMEITNPEFAGTLDPILLTWIGLEIRTKHTAKRRKDETFYDLMQTGLGMFFIGRLF